MKNARGSCCDLVNRGVAVWKGKVYVGSFEGILYALDARDGTVRWQVDTIEHGRAYSITGAPQIAGKVVVIGNALPPEAFAETSPAVARAQGTLRVGMIARMNARYKNHLVRSEERV